MGQGMGRTACLVTGVVIAAGFGLAAAQGLSLAYELSQKQRNDLRVKPGLWEMSTVHSGNPPMKQKICLSAPANEIYIDPLQVMGMTTCPSLVVTKSGTTVNIRSSCRLVNGVIQNTTVVRHLTNDDAFHQTSQVSYVPKKSRTVKSETTAKWISDCSPETMSGDIFLGPDDSIKLNLFLMLTPESE